MAESGLSLGFSDFKAEVGFYLGYGRSGWASAQETEIEGLVQSGVRLVYYPPAVTDPTGQIKTAGYEWKWLKPYTTISTVLPYATGTVAIASGVVTLTSGTFPAWTADGTIEVSGSEYTVDTRDGDTQATLDDTSVTVAAGTSYNLRRDTYTLPDDLGRIVGKLHYPLNEYRASIELIASQQLLEMRASIDLTGAPSYAATRFKASDRTTGQRQEVLFYPTPDTVWVLHYQYEAYSGALSNTYPYPLGGMKLSELYIESCLAVAERRIHDAPGTHTEQFNALLLDAIARDMKNSAHNFGFMGNIEEMDQVFRRGWTGGTYPLTYKGEDV
jgi:hypothetical protein